MPGGPEWSFVSVEMRGLHIRCGWPLDPLHAMQFRAGPLPQVRGGCPAQRAPGSDRDCPLVTDAYGTPVARPTRTTTSHLEATASSSIGGYGPFSVTTVSWATREGGAAALGVTSSS